MEQPSIVLEEELSDPVTVLEPEEAMDLVADCLAFVQDVLSRSNPKWLQAEGLKLEKRMSDALGWYQIH